MTGPILLQAATTNLPSVVVAVSACSTLLLPSPRDFEVINGSSSDGKARQIDLMSGEVVWDHDHGSWVCSVHVDGGYLYTGCKDGKARRMLL